jgi:hypothetical protein
MNIFNSAIHYALHFLTNVLKISGARRDEEGHAEPAYLCQERDRGKGALVRNWLVFQFEHITLKSIFWTLPAALCSFVFSYIPSVHESMSQIHFG